MKTTLSSRMGTMRPMAISVRSILALTVVTLVFFAFSTASAEAQISISSVNSTYSQNFDGMGAGSFGLSDDLTGSLPGFYSLREFGNTSPNLVESDDGSGTTGNFKNYGLSSESDRALGFLPDGTTGFMRLGARFVNNTGVQISSVTVTFTAEQWRNGGSGAAQAMTFAYRKDTSVNDLMSGVYTVVPSLTFTSPVNGPFPSDVDGNNPANRATLTAVLPIVMMPGEELMLRWEMTDEFGEDQGMAVDNLQLIAQGASTAADASIAGRVMDANGRGIARVRVQLMGGTLAEPRYAMTNAFGNYQFDELESGEAYLLRVEAKKYRFLEPVIFVNLGDNMTGMDFVAKP